MVLIEALRLCWIEQREEKINGTGLTGRPGGAHQAGRPGRSHRFLPSAGAPTATLVAYKVATKLLVVNQTFFFFERVN